MFYKVSDKFEILKIFDIYDSVLLSLVILTQE